MVLALTLVFPLLLLGLMLLMERVERPLTRRLDSEQFSELLQAAPPDRLEAYVSEGLRPTLERYWRHRMAPLAPRRLAGRRFGWTRRRSAAT
jgi:hypothetical protein